jgi:hypothetical protein
VPRVALTSMLLIPYHLIHATINDLFSTRRRAAMSA